MNRISLVQSKLRRFLLLLCSAGLTGLTLVFPKLGFLEWITLIPLAIFLIEYAADRSVRLRSLYGYGLFFFWSFYLVVFHWFINLYPLDFIDGMTKGGAIAVVLAAWIGLSLFQAVMGGLCFVVVGLLLRLPKLERFWWSKPFLIAGVWSVYEWTQTLGWWGVPWGRLPIGQSSYLVGLQTASWFGSYFVTFVLVAVNASLALGICAWLRKEERTARIHIRFACLASVAMLVFQYGAGTLIWTLAPTSEKIVRVAAVQGNISSHEKWELAHLNRTMEVYWDYTMQAAEQGAEIVVWPETALPYEVDAETEYLVELAKQSGAVILVGAFTNEEADRGDYNSIVCFLPDGTMHESIYSKRRLVPFGEFVPWSGLIRTLIPPLADLVMSEDSVEWGEGSNLFTLDQGKVGSLICFDSIYEGLTRESVRDGAELLCLSTNDSWFTDSAALYMHNAQAQLRAIESGRQVVRSANTGISTVITARGEVTADLAPLVDGILVEDVSLHSHTTLYTYIGNLFVYLWIIILTFLLMLGGVFRVRKVFQNLDSTKKS